MSKDTGLWSVNPPDAHTRALILMRQLWPSRCSRCSKESVFSIRECAALMTTFAAEESRKAAVWEKLAHEAVNSQLPSPIVLQRSENEQPDPAASTNIKTQL